MTWEEFRELFMGKFFPASIRHAKSWEFLELEQGTMTMLEYVAKFTELARFADDYVATYMAKVRKFEDGLKLSIGAKLWDFSCRTWTRWSGQLWSLREKWMTHETSGMWVLKIRGRRVNLLFLLARGRSKRLLPRKYFKDRAVATKARVDHLQVVDLSRLIASQGRGHVSIAINLDT